MRASFSLLGLVKARTLSRNPSGCLVYALCLCAVLLAPQAWAVTPQSLIPGAATGDAAAQSEKAEADLAVSLDKVISTLENDKERKALTDELKHLRAVLPEAAAEQKSKPTGNLLENISRSFEILIGRVEADMAPVNFWRQRIATASNEMAVPYLNSEGQPIPNSGSAFLLVLSVWALVALVLIQAVKYICSRLGIRSELAPNPSTQAIALYVLRHFGPWIIAFMITIGLVHSAEISRGKTLALVLAYAVVCGAVLSSICALLFSLCTDGHRRVAVHSLLAHAPMRLIYAIGVCFALSDAVTGPRVARVFPPTVLSLTDSLITVVTALLIGIFALAYRRPVMHLIANRPFKLRHEKGMTEVRQFLGKLWAPLMIVIVVAAVFITLFVPDNTNAITQRVVASIALLMLALFSGLLLRREWEKLTPAPGKRRRRFSFIYAQRFRGAFGRFLAVAIWLVFFEFTARTWGYSLIDFMHQPLGKMLVSVFSTAFVAWLVWAVVDTAILEALSPHPRKSGGAAAKASSARALTLLPLCRGAAGAGIGGVAAIVALANLGIDITPFIAGAGVIGLAVGFGAQSLVQDIITGLFILIEDTISVGDYIETSNHAGTVEGLSIRTVRLRDMYGTLHTIPFSQIKTVKNLSRQFACAVFEIGVSYSADIDAVMRAMRAVGAEMMEDYRLRRDLMEPLDVQGIIRFADSAVIVRAIFKTRPLKQWAISREFNLRLKKRFDAEGIEIPFPQMELHLPRQEAPPLPAMP